MNQVKIIAFGILFGMAGFLIGIGTQIQQNSAQNASIAPVWATAGQKVSMMVDTGDNLLGFSNVPIHKKDTVYSVLDRLAEENKNLELDAIDYGGLGMFIDSINGKINGNNNKYWQYWINNEYGTVSADKRVLLSGDVVFWKFTSSRFKNFKYLISKQIPSTKFQK